MRPISITAGGGDSLTRTTLQIGDDSTAALIAAVVSALKHVPGVLLADINPARNRVIVAHDGAVPIAALVSAATSAGVFATVVRDRPAPERAAPSAVPPPRMRAFPTIAIMAGIAVALLLVQLFVPESVQKRLLVNTFVLATWIVFFAGVLIRRKS
jgi:cation transport ATPase